MRIETGLSISDCQSGFRAYSFKAFENVNIIRKGMSASIEILEKARRAKLNIMEVSISCFYAHSRLNIAAIKHGLGVALAVIKIRSEKYPPK